MNTSELHSKPLSEQQTQLDQFSLIRSFDLITWSLVGFYVLLVLTMQDIFLVAFPFLTVIPLFFLSYGATILPPQFIDSASWRNLGSRFRFYSLLCAFNFPFVIFIQIAEKDIYFSICAGLAIFSFVQILLAVSEYCRLISELMNEKVIASEARLAVKLIYGFALTAVGIMAVFIVEANFLKVLAQRGLLDVVYKLSVLVLVFPLIFPVTLLFRLKFMLIQNYKNRLRGKV